jgi:tRNA1Val (adenine37-N6)-methyltransferase
MGTSKSRESVFRFKQFEVVNSLSAMKVGTDGVLLGAWADVAADACSEPVRVLDVGTGSGLIALMLAQRFRSARIVGVDIVAEACREARANADASQWGDRVDIVCADFSEFASSAGAFDAVVSNPPFFKTDLKAPEQSRMLARHGAGLDYGVIIRACAAGLLAPGGVLSMVSPADREGDITFDMEMAGLRLSRLVRVVTKSTATAPTRLLWEMRRKSPDACAAPAKIDSLVVGSDGYRRLTGDFYLQY